MPPLGRSQKKEEGSEARGETAGGRWQGAGSRDGNGMRKEGSREGWRQVLGPGRSSFRLPQPSGTWVGHFPTEAREARTWLTA